jgi:imidazolonepropionase-like amidohydrolase
MRLFGLSIKRLALSLFCFLLFLLSVPASELLPPGFRPLPLGVHALVGGKVFVKPGETLDPGTILIRDGLIQAVGKDVAVPPDARVWDMKGLTIYAGFIEPYLALGATNPPVSTSDTEPLSGTTFASGGSGVKFYGAPGAKTDMGNAGPGSAVAKVVPEFRAIEKYSPDEKVLAPLRELGFTAAVIVPGRGIVRGVSALVSLADENPNRVVVRPELFQNIAFDTRGGEENAYPGSVMGVIAAVRQSFFDARHYTLEQADYARRPQGRKPPQFDPALAALGPAADRKMRVMFEPGSALMDDRAAQVSRELGLDFSIVSSGQEWRRPDLVKATGATFIVPLNFPTLPDFPNDEDWDQVSLDQLRAWDWASENPALLRQQGLEIALTTYSLTDKKKFRPNLQLALDRGLSETNALAALTTVPAKLCGVESQLGTIEPGKLAHLTVVDGAGYFDPRAKVREVWIDGRIYRVPSDEPKAGKASEKTTPPTSEPGTTTRPKEEPERSAKPPELVTQERSGTTNQTEVKVAEEKKPEDKTKDQVREVRKVRAARSPMEGRGPITNPPAVFIQNATIWTCGPQGTLENASLLVRDGKVVAVNPPGLAGDTRFLNIDGRGLHITPGIVDCHSHSFVVGGVNEMTLPSTAMVRISDVINSETDNVYQQLAGGVTAANVLHGSANPIGGQNCVIKLRLGASPEAMVFTNAPLGIKFALGENVKQSNWGDRNTTRFPQTRMGVRTFVQNRFMAAQEYLKEWDEYRKATNALKAGQASSLSWSGKMPALPPARDLELEAIGEILQGKRLIHCHGYRQDEMLMLMRLMESFDVKIATFQHVLEGYKIADEMARHGAGGSCFSDWWAYKFEVYDAIPYDGSLMRDRGVVVSFNSDSSDLARRLYLEAAKAVKYGGTPEIEALKFVTLNPAKQLRIDKYVGSLEAGKDADFVLWSKSPLDSSTVCLQTWIDGKKYFDRSQDDERTARLKKEREDLLAKAKKITKAASGGDRGGGDDTKAFFQRSLEHEYDGTDRHCLEEER